MAKPFRLPDADEQVVLDELEVRPIYPEEQLRWEQEVSEHHYLKNATLVGEHLRYAVTFRGQWLACLGWSGPARHLKPRDQWIGGSADPLARRRHGLANNARYGLWVERPQLPNVASRGLALCGQRLSADWLARWGHPLIAVESFVAAQLFRGTAYKASGWTLLGPTSGYGRVAEDYYERHERPKQLWVRALDAKGFAALRAEPLPVALTAYEVAPPPQTQTAPRLSPAHPKPVGSAAGGTRSPRLSWPLSALARGLGDHRSGQAGRHAPGPAAYRRVGPTTDPTPAPGLALPARGNRPHRLSGAFGKHFPARLGRLGFRRL